MPGFKKIIQNRYKKIAFLSILILPFSVIGNNNSTDSIFRTGTEQYKNEQFFESIQSFESILNRGYESFETYYNLGNACFKTNQIPEAIYYYEKSLQLRPGSDDAIYNLDFINSLIQKDVLVVPEAFHIRFADSVMKWMTTDGWGTTGILLFILTLTFFGLFLFHVSFRLKKIMFYFSVLFLIMTLSSLFFGYRLYDSLNHPSSAIIMVSSAGIKSAPDKASADVYVAQAGMKVKIISKLGDWYEIRVPDGNKGWISTETVRIL